MLYEEVLHHEKEDGISIGTSEIKLPGAVKMSLNGKVGNSRPQQSKKPDEAVDSSNADETELDITGQTHKVWCFFILDTVVDRVGLVHMLIF